MSILDNPPHTCTFKVRTRTPDSRAGTVDTYTAVYTNLPAWRQYARQSEIVEFAKREVEVTDMLFVFQFVEVSTKHIVEVTDQNGVVTTYDVMTEAQPDAVGDTVWKIMLRLSSSGATP